MSYWCDRIITGGILFLVVFTPFAFGSVHPWAFSTMEAVIFLLVTVWMAKILCVRREQGAASREQGGTSKSFFVFGRPSSVFRLSSLFVPLALFLVFCLLQIVPLPPALLGILSPQTYEVYTRSIPGWPEGMPWSGLSVKNSRPDSPAPLILPTAQQVRSGTPVPFADRSAAPVASSAPRSRLFDLGSLLPETWFPLSLAPSLTQSDLLKLTAYGALFFLILLYPFGSQFSAYGGHQSAVSAQSSVLSPHHSVCMHAEARFIRAVLLVMLLTGLLVAAVGFVQSFSWNGKILWFFVPYDWVASMAGATPRSSGPFVNPVHFASYLSLILPLSLAGALSRTFNMRTRLEEGFRVFCVLTTFVVFTGILLSLSRSGWIGALLGIAILLWFSRWGREEPEAGSGEQELGSRRQGAGSTKGRKFRIVEFGFRNSVSGRRSPLRIFPAQASIPRHSLIIVCTLLAASLFFVGPGGRGQVDVRLGETVAEDMGLWGRATLWKDSLGMIRDFPILGVGLGSWPELFPRYRGAPWSPDFHREAHNDYLELLAETGIVGFFLLSWFFFQAGRFLIRGVKAAPRETATLPAAMLAAVGAMAFHELVDFSLQIPGNAFIFTLLFALGLRMTGSRDNGALSNQHSAVSTRRSVVSQQWPAIRPAVLGAVALALAVISLRQEQIPYPYNLREPHTSAEGRDLLQSHPANVFAHVSLLRLQESTAPLSWQLTISSAALWLEPTNPYIRDFHAAMLIRSGKTAEGMREISRSVLDSPVLSNHVYLSARLLPWLSTQEQEAAEDGFKKALAQKYPGALDSLAGFYGGLGRFWDQGRLYERAAVEESDKATISTFLVNAGIAYSKARDNLNAERMWRSAIGAKASDPRPYQLLATAVYGPKKNLGAAREIISDGIRNGASPLLLYLSLAEAAGKAGSAVESKAALSSAQAEVKKALGKSEDPYVLYLLIADAARRLRGKEEEKAALLAALDHRPRASNTLFRLANLYFEERDFDRAAFYYGKIATISPNAADVYFQLAVAEEGRYHFSAADKAYARAVELAPDNKLFKERYDSLRRRVAADRKS